MEEEVGTKWLIHRVAVTKENECFNSFKFSCIIIVSQINRLNFISYLNHVSKKLFHASFLEQSKMKSEALQM